MLELHQDALQLQQIYQDKKEMIEKRLNEFIDVYKKSDQEIFAELCFCLLTPQSKAKLCWASILKLQEKDLLFDGDAQEIKKWLAGVRFHETKAKHIVTARQIFFKDGLPQIKNNIEQFRNLDSNIDAFALREWLIKNVKGYGYKESSHFLRNIGIGHYDLAILDRHILKNLVKYDVIISPKSLTPKIYLEIEDKMKRFAHQINIPFAHLDLLFWSMEAGEVFK